MWIVENSIHVWRKSSSSRLSMIQYVHLYCCEKARVLKCSLRRHKPRHPFPLQPLLSFTKIAPIWLLCCLLFGIRRTPCTLHHLHWTCLNSFPFIPQPHSLICIAFHYAQTKNIQHPQMTVSDISWCTVNVYVLACVCVGFPYVHADMILFQFWDLSCSGLWNAFNTLMRWQVIIDPPLLSGIH